MAVVATLPDSPCIEVSARTSWLAVRILPLHTTDLQTDSNRAGCRELQCQGLEWSVQCQCTVAG